MNIRDLEYFVALADYRHFRKAAESCNVSQPTLSGQIRKLEDELGVMLLERTSRKVLFTQTGLMLVEQAQEILRNVQIFKEMACKQGEDMSGPIHIGLIPTLAPYLLPHIVTLLHDTYPSLELYLHEAQTHVLVSQLEQGRLDCVILAKVKEASPFIELPLFDEEMVIAMPESNPLCKNNVIDLSTLGGEKFLMLEDGHCLRDHAMGYCFSAGIDEDKRFKATSLETLRSMISAGRGITLFPELAAPNERIRDNICYIPCINPTPVRTIELIYRPGSPLRARYEQLAKKISAHMPKVFVKKKKLLQVG
ncbi:LysR family hydrogen peroxide-inducible transcriptional activator [Orbus hercynius]|uniref:LysR family hydrogen peroxide-inducible transcriptional activator n=1 Tax=Orbus hercynius TaxID=593135 RepID=A0A495RCL2_9GAMM|nr:DNA-binding transcriptional regulator OxyR [Orbus hercynius]RKS85217.1 LysR family hydrogen peroxide-inducible transcriptional activator [Orbus hercynius]